MFTLLFIGWFIQEGKISLAQMTKLDNEIPSVFLPLNLSGPIGDVWALLSLLIKMFISRSQQGTSPRAAQQGRDVWANPSSWAATARAALTISKHIYSVLP